MNLSKFVLYSTILSIFTEAWTYHIGIDLKFFYLVIIINLFILFIMDKVYYSKGLLVFHSIILLTGIYSCLIGYNKIYSVLEQFIPIFIISVFYYSYFTYYKDKLNEIILFYCKCCLLLAIIGFLRLPLDILKNKAFHSIMLEPAHYCAIVLPAFYITLHKHSFPRYYYRVLLLSVIISGSSLGFIGIAVALWLSMKRKSFVKISLIALAISISLSAAYIAYPPFKLRVDDTVKSITESDLSGVNLSTYALVSNMYVAVNSFKASPLIGNGVGSHIYSREKYLLGIEGVESIGDDYINLNAKDANSLLIRILSEFGIIGILGIVYFIFKFRVKFKDDATYFNFIISSGIIIYFVCKLLREGHYFSPEMYFFVFLFVFNKYWSYRNMYNIRPKLYFS